AAQFAMQWNWKQPPARWTEVVLAVAEHDDGEVEFNSGDLLTSAGGPVNFSMKKFDAGRCTKLARIALSRSRYVALLTSMHMVFLYEDEARENKEADAFLQAEKEKQKVWISELSIDTEEMKK